MNWLIDGECMFVIWYEGNLMNGIECCWCVCCDVSVNVLIIEAMWKWWNVVVDWWEIMWNEEMWIDCDDVVDWWLLDMLMDLIKWMIDFYVGIMKWKCWCMFVNDLNDWYDCIWLNDWWNCVLWWMNWMMYWCECWCEKMLGNNPERKKE